MNEIKDKSIETFQSEKSKRNKKKKRIDYLRSGGSFNECNICTMGTAKGKKENRKNIWSINDWEFPQINVGYQNIFQKAQRTQS